VAIVFLVVAFIVLVFLVSGLFSPASGGASPGFSCEVPGFLCESASVGPSGELSLVLSSELNSSAVVNGAYCSSKNSTPSFEELYAFNPGLALSPGDSGVLSSFGEGALYCVGGSGQRLELESGSFEGFVWVGYHDFASNEQVVSAGQLSVFFEDE